MCVVCVCVCVCMYICICVHVCVCVYTYVCVYVCVYVCACVWLCVCIHMCVYTYVHVCVCVYTYVCVYVCVYVCACIHAVCVYAVSHDGNDDTMFLLYVLLICTLTHGHHWTYFSANCSDYEIRLVDGRNRNEGIVESCFKGHWLPVCSSGWSDEEPAVVCQQLGLSTPDSSMCLHSI